MAVDNSLNHYKALLRRGHEPCDFCDRTFKNRFDSIIHNASHIIIPLMKQNWYRCNICLYYFPTPEDLFDHHKTNHPNIAIDTQNVNNVWSPKIKFENSNEYDQNCSIIETHDDYNLDNTRHFSVENSIIKRENNTDDVKENYSCNSLEIKSEAIKVEVNDCDNGIVDLTEKDYRTLSNENSESIKSRLTFEEGGLFDDNVLGDLITECKVKMFNEPINQMNLSPQNDIKNTSNSRNSLNIRNTPIQNLVSEIIKSNFRDGLIQNGDTENTKNDNNVCNKLVTEDYEYDNFALRNIPRVERFNGVAFYVNDVQNVDKCNVPIQEPAYRSVHYNDLVKPGIFSCKYCFRVFPNRLLLIQHEPTHINIKKSRPLLCTYCDKYIAGNHVRLHRHITREHPGAPVDKKHQTFKCTKCSLKFSQYLSHVRNYHPYDCHSCGKEFTENLVDELNEHLKTCATKNVLSKVMNVCELCFSFFKVRINLKYDFMGTTVNEPGVRYPCAVCGKQYFELKMIRRLIYGSHIGNIMSGRRDYKCTKTRRPLTNEERLKKFQHRLKQINLLNKFYFAVLFSRTLKKKLEKMHLK
ncbi:oocyte zinc finger protein XlCOF8.4-like [Maniola jurtina]|uniref:oocyte zinc finger protein XlCOF8.4-like n=1 Tax=Maniola jurtina TaxID=191418 RepID=UPI001E68F5F4|nr:oocyte zinc finger protein XlCOF8.4-like [Maniola jurtina]XP_045781473.1 oocyte zinc finger protein XlCOF8.4-like [Maniola jurtina]XP_045781474.1 oocyte zinc finger protein XlCOF8.4-like [Maniola jurtina]